MNHRDSRRNYRLGIATAIVFSFMASILLIAAGRAYDLDAWLLIPINLVVGCACGYAASLLFPVTPAVRDDEDGGRRT
jgi:hypothetical protein